MFKWFRQVASELAAISSGLGGLTEAVHAVATARDPDASVERRVAQLELELERRAAEAEGLLLKAKGKLDAARAAEERERRLASRSTEGGDDLDDEAVQEIVRAYEEAGISLDDGVEGGREGMQPVHGRVGRRHESKSNARAMKFNRAGGR